MNWIARTVLACMFLSVMACGESSTGEGTSADRSAVSSDEQSKSETPQEAAAAILELVKAEDYKTLIEERYSEWQRSLAMPESPPAEQMIEQLSLQYAEQRDVLLGVYGLLAEAEFVITDDHTPQPGETGRVATATVTYQGQEVRPKLYEMENGRWGFHQ
ncbi:MAG: hypothetical protein AAGC44_12700 [Planctomycetota bacterium]